MSKRHLLGMYVLKSRHPGVRNRNLINEALKRSFPKMKNSRDNIVRIIKLSKNTLLYLCIERLALRNFRITSFGKMFTKYYRSGKIFLDI